jgi:hypothetical protein
MENSITVGKSWSIDKFNGKTLVSPVIKSLGYLYLKEMNQQHIPDKIMQLRNIVIKQAHWINISHVTPLGHIILTEPIGLTP